MSDKPQATLAVDCPRVAGLAAPSRWLAVSPRYYIALAILLLSAVGMQGLAKFSKRYFTKLPVELKRPLFELQPDRLAPEYIFHTHQPENLDHEMIESLGTTEYVNRNLIDTRRDAADTTHTVQVSVSYYTGKPDLVPHNPRECMRAGGWTLLTDETRDVPLQRLDGSSVTIPVAVLQFEEPTRAGKPRVKTVLFFFEANGGFVNTRNEVRLRTQWPFDRYAYYAKIEISFVSDRGEFASREESMAALAPLLNKLMPALWRDHFQDLRTYGSAADGAPHAD